MRLRSILALVVLGLSLSMAPAFTPAVRADDTPKEQPKRGGPMQFLEHYRATIDKLNITTEQKPKIDAAFTDAKTKVEAAMKDAAGDRDAMRAKMQPIIKDLTQTVIAVLTPEQQEQLKKSRQNRDSK